MRLSSLGLYMGICLGLGSYLGVLADHRWHTGVVWTLVGFAVGVAAGFYGLFNELGRLNSK
jgi:predicted cobalt transporter CbtA